jgi:hypothetical protein
VCGLLTSTTTSTIPYSLAHRLLRAQAADVGEMETEAEEEPEGKQYARKGRPFLMMRPAVAAIADFSNTLPEDENVSQSVQLFPCAYIYKYINE